MSISLRFRVSCRFFLLDSLRLLISCLRDSIKDSFCLTLEQRVSISWKSCSKDLFLMIDDFDF